jgi:hypothetical protein
MLALAVPRAIFQVTPITLAHGNALMVWAMLNDDIRIGAKEITDSSSDRVVAIMGAALVEEALRQALSARLRKGSTQDKMLKPGGALGEFFAKINLGYLLLMYDTHTQSALIGIAEIRNLFAHKLNISSFDADTRSLIDGFGKLKLHTNYTQYPSPGWDGYLNTPVEK